MDTICVAHGAMEYRIGLDEIHSILSWLNERGGEGHETIYVRLLYEQPWADDSKEAREKEETFRDFCREVSREYGNLTFCGGQRKYDWSMLYDFGVPHPACLEKYSSRTWMVLDDWCPAIYAFVMNGRNKKRYLGEDSEKLLLIDFV